MTPQALALLAVRCRWRLALRWQGCGYAAGRQDRLQEPQTAASSWRRRLQWVVLYEVVAVAVVTLPQLAAALVGTAVPALRLLQPLPPPQHRHHRHREKATWQAATDATLRRLPQKYQPHHRYCHYLASLLHQRREQPVPRRA